MDNENTEYTVDWDLYQKGIDYKHKIGLYETVDKNNRFFQGDQWHGVEANGLPTPVFNVIKPVIRYKISTLMQNNVKICYSCGNNFAGDKSELSDAADKLTKYSEKLWEQLKMDFYAEKILKDGAITGDGIAYFYFDDEKQEVCLELVDSVNLYPANPNTSEIQEQDYIIISFRRTVKSVKQEARDNNISEDDVESIVGDSDTHYQAGDGAKVEMDDSGKCVVLLKMWRDDKTDTIHFRKSTRNVIICDDTDTGCKLYPVALFNWEPQKNCFHGVSDVTGLIPNQLYINKIAAMIMLSTMYTAFPKMVYDEDLVDNPSNQIGVAIGVNGSDRPLKSIIDYIAPAAVSGDAFSMFERTISLTKELMGANDAALGSIDPEKASGKAILAIMEQSNQPLESIRNNFYNFIEDIALIWADMWSAYTGDSGKDIYFTDKNGEDEAGNISKAAFESMMLQVKIDVGPSSRWSEVAVCQTLDNLLINKLIPFDWYVDLMPENSGFPKQKIQEKLEQAQRQQMAQAAQNQEVDMLANEQIAQNTPNIDALLAAMPEETRQQALQNPQLLQQIIAQQMGIQQ